MKTLLAVVAGLVLATSSPLLASGDDPWWFGGDNPWQEWGGSNPWSGWGAKSISTCGVIISQPGEYHLASDLVCPTGYAVTIASSDVNFYMEGHTLEGRGTGVIGVLVSGVSNVSVFGDGTINGFDGGVIVTNSTQTTIEKITATNSIGSDLGAGIILENSSCNKIVKCVFNNNKLLGVEILGHAVTGSTGSTTCMNTGYSPNCKMPSDEHSMKIRLCYNTSPWDQSGKSENNTVTSTVADGNGVGILLKGADYNVLCENEANSNGFGFDVYPGATHNMFHENQAHGTRFGNVDIFEQNSSCGSDTWSYNSFGRANQTCVR